MLGGIAAEVAANVIVIDRTRKGKGKEQKLDGEMDERMGEKERGERR